MPENSAQFTFRYDGDADAAYLSFDETAKSQSNITNISTPAMDGEIIVDLDAENRVIGLEFLGASRILPPGLTEPGKDAEPRQR